MGKLSGKPVTPLYLKSSMESSIRLFLFDVYYVAIENKNIETGKNFLVPTSHMILFSTILSSEKRTIWKLRKGQRLLTPSRWSS